MDKVTALIKYDVVGHFAVLESKNVLYDAVASCPVRLRVGTRPGVRSKCQFGETGLRGTLYTGKI
jgi:hypothetical protein